MLDYGFGSSPTGGCLDPAHDQPRMTSRAFVGGVKYSYFFLNPLAVGPHDEGAAIPYAGAAICCAGGAGAAAALPNPLAAEFQADDSDDDSTCTVCEDAAYEDGGDKGPSMNCGHRYSPGAAGPGCALLPPPALISHGYCHRGDGSADASSTAAAFGGLGAPLGCEVTAKAVTSGSATLATPTAMTTAGSRLRKRAPSLDSSAADLVSCHPTQPTAINAAVGAGGGAARAARSASAPSAETPAAAGPSWGISPVQAAAAAPASAPKKQQPQPDEPYAPRTPPLATRGAASAAGLRLRSGRWEAAEEEEERLQQQQQTASLPQEGTTTAGQEGRELDLDHRESPLLSRCGSAAEPMSLEPPSPTAHQRRMFDAPPPALALSEERCSTAAAAAAIAGLAADDGANGSSSTPMVLPARTVSNNPVGAVTLSGSDASVLGARLPAGSSAADRSAASDIDGSVNDGGTGSRWVSTLTNAPRCSISGLAMPRAIVRQLGLLPPDLLLTSE